MRFTDFLVILLLSCTIVLNASSQELFKPIHTPTASGLLNLNAHDVSLFTGTPNINMPLYSHTVDGYNINVGLSYASAGGIRVSDRSGEVGLGWHLSGIGSIVRTVKGHPDEMKYLPKFPDYYEYRYGYLNGANASDPLHRSPFGNIDWDPVGWQGIADNSNDQVNVYNQVLKPLFGENIRSSVNDIDHYYKLLHGQLIDTEPDIFEFNFNGKSGKFIFNNQNGNITVHQIPWQGLKIEYTLAYSIHISHVSIDHNYHQEPDDMKRQSSPVIVSFTITDTDNTKYYFEAYDHVRSNYRTNYVAYKPPQGTGGFVDPPGMYYDNDEGRWRLYNGSPQHEYDEENGGHYVEDNNPYSPAGYYLDGAELSRFYVNSWKLTKVVTPNGKEINYNYSNHTSYRVKVANVQEKNKFLTYKTTSGGQSTLLDVISNGETSLVVRNLTSITSDDFKIEFTRGTQQSTFTSVDKVKVYNGEHLVKHFDMRYITSVSKDVHLATGTDKNEYYRSILTELREYDRLELMHRSYKFSYNLESLGGLTGQKLPHTYSYSVDQWGYFNGADNTDYIPRLYIYPDISMDNRRFRVDSIPNYSGRAFMMEGSDRSSHAEYLTTGMLRKITYPTGGSVAYEYEPNTYLDEGHSSIGPGVRIKKIISSSGSQEEEVNYSYNEENGQTSGRVVAKPVMARVLSHIRDNPINDFLYYQNNLSRYGDSQAELSSVDSRLLGYGQVTEFRAGQGKTVYNFSNQGILGQNDDSREEDEDGDGNPVTFGGCIEADCDGFFWRPNVRHVTFYLHDQYNPRFLLDQPKPDTYPYAPAPNYDWNRGHLLMQTVYDNQGSRLQEVRNRYRNVTPRDRSLYLQSPVQIKGLKVGQMVVGRPNDNPMVHGSSQSKGLTLRAAKYGILVDIAKVLSSTTTTRYHGGGENPMTESVTCEYKNKETVLPTKVTKTNSRGETETVEYYYPSDLLNDQRYNVGNVLTKMVSKGIVNKPILTRHKVNNMYTSEIFNRYREENWLGHISYRLGAVYQSNDGIGIDPNLDLDKKIEIEYSMFGEVNSYIEDKKMWSSIYRGYKARYPVVVAKGIDYGTIQGFLLSNHSYPDDYQRIYDVQDGNIYPGSFNDLRESFPDSQIENYTYNEIGLMSSKTDARGISEYYEYDDFNRLQSVKDHSGNIIKTYCYNYKGDPIPCYTYDDHTPIYDSRGKLLARVWGSTNLNDYAMSSFEASPGGGAGSIMKHNLFYDGAGPVSDLYFSGFRSLEFGDTPDDPYSMSTPAILDPNKEYKIRSNGKSVADWNSPWNFFSRILTGVSYFEVFFSEWAIDDFILYPVGSFGEMYIYNADGTLHTTIKFD